MPFHYGSLHGVKHTGLEWFHLLNVLFLCLPKIVIEASGELRLVCSSLRTNLALEDHTRGQVALDNIAPGSLGHSEPLHHNEVAVLSW